MNLRPYSKYKDSGVPWLGQVPKDWVNYPGLAVLKEKQVRNTGLKEKTVLSLSYGKIKVKSMDKMHGLVPESFETYQIVEPGDIIIRATDLQNDKTSLRIGKVKDKGIITSAYLRLKPQPTFNKDYAYTLLHGLDLMKVFYGMGSGLRQNLSWIDFKRMPFFLPPLPEQNQIVRYLDWKTVQIAKFIKDKKRMIELLKEQKQVIINDAVTGKIDVTTGKPYPKYKDSGAEWLGQVPDGWDVRKFSTLSRVIRGASPRPASDSRYFNGSYMSWVTVGEVTKDNNPYLQSTETFLTEAGARNSRFIQNGTLIITNSGATLGVPKILKIDVCANDGIVAYVNLSNLVNKLFAYYYLSTLTTRIRDELRQGGTQPNLNTNMIKEMYCPIPAKREQILIVSEIEKQNKLINLVISRTEREIGLMQEYRDRLIADVVTGKLDVRGIAVPEVLEELSTDDADEEPDEIENEEEA
ncbi:MAG: restriction endonuclease subunit S [Victivallaceae bacterium]|jgi:type I restriction enzyme S subunit